MGSSASGHPGLRRSVVESAIVLLLVGFAPAILAAELFRYRNSDGVIVLANTIPAEYARNGYTVIDHRGRVLRVVPRQLSGAELEARPKPKLRSKRRKPSDSPGAERMKNFFASTAPPKMSIARWSESLRLSRAQSTP